MFSGQYCCCDFEKYVDYNNIRYYISEGDRINAVKKGRW